MFEAPSYNSFRDILITSFLMPKFAKGNNSKKKNYFKIILPALIIIYQLTKFEAPGYNSFRDILITSFLMSKFAQGTNLKKLK